MADALKEAPLTAVKFTDEFWAPKLRTNRTVTVWHNIKMCEQTGRLANFRRAAGMEPGTHQGLFFNDSDIYKVIEGASYILATDPDEKLDAKLDEWIAIVAKAQQPDGYLYTFHQLKAPQKRFTNLKDEHELYCAGHLIEAAVAHHQATKKKSLLDVATKLADLIDQTWGPGKRTDPDGHEEIELALIKLADETGQQKYRKLADFFLAERGRGTGRKLYGEYHQDHKPLEETQTVTGHAVRQMYFLAAATDVALRGDKRYVAAIDRMWDDMTEGKLYVTGGVGARHAGEAFGESFELPNESAYAETCAGIGNAMWSDRLARLHAAGKYVDTFERALYNGFLSGVSLSGDKYFYVNPLASRGTHHRVPWFECACCPPNVLRFMASLPSRVYSTQYDPAENVDTVYVNLYAGSDATLKFPDGDVRLKQETRYPWDGKVRLTVNLSPNRPLNLLARIPSWAEGVTATVNGTNVPVRSEDGYARFDGTWKDGSVLELNFPMPVRRLKADPRVKDNAGRVALQRGPIVYCAEAVDHGGHVSNLYLPPDAQLTAEHRPDLLDGVTVITGKAMAKVSAKDPAPKEVPFTAVPYYAWDNRSGNAASGSPKAGGEMAVWLAEDPALAQPPPEPTVASLAKPSASHVGGNGNLAALHDREPPKNSRSGAHFAWWPHNGTTEWVQYDFDREREVTASEVYFFSDVPHGGCDAPESWRLLYRTGDAASAGASAGGGEWKLVEQTGGDYSTKKDAFNRVTFKPVRTTALRLEVQLKPKVSGGVMEWRVEEAPPR
ncbi:MAG TPA: glycoside hydrolase family 127 protein [Tepidisphaeraceae bacterium]|nr:glycoside hydrolase family 127 protein [Tepidisphaeraceae bacterium]